MDCTPEKLIDFREREKKNPLTCAGVEKSIQEAYINAIRMASRFIYIENQYFMGSSNFWSSPKEGCENRIPIEIAMKIEQKIREGKKFTAFIGIFLPDF